jgi:FlaA1/EpsC-like NDP-sugar epimerase
MTKTEMAEEMDTESTGGGSLLRPVKLFLLHIVFFTLSLLLSFLGYDNMQMGDWWFPELFLYWLGFTLIVKLTIFGILHQYQGWWRYASVSDLLSIIKGSHFSTLIIVVLWFFVQEFGVAKFVPALKQMPHAVMLMDWAATIVVICGVRLAIRLYYEETQTVSSGRLSRLLVVGAGNAGEVLLREIHRMGETRYEVVGFIDDDPKKIGVRIHGVPVLASCEKIKEIAKKRNIDEIVIAMPSATHKQMRRVVELCRGTNLRFSTVPDLVAIASGQVKVSQIRDVDINDLLGREPVRLDTEQISRFIKDKVILITGAGGSIGSEMCRQVSQFQPRTLLLLEQAENGLFFVERELRRNFPQIDYRAIICDIVDRKRVDWVFETYGPKVVFHAAAHKHVPLMELNPGEAIKNNVIGTRNVAEAADQFGSSHFVMISTDKAVNPTSIMGSSKRIAEMTIQCLNKRSNTDYVTVRFGNVLGSNGSVIPIFKDQIAAGGPVTVTHPEMQRYFMTIPEASQLVLQSATMGQGGEVFVLDMGEPVKIVDLARDLITLSGFRPGEDIEIKFTGMRPGEKLFEELAMTGENMQPTRHPKIGIWKNLPPDEKSLRHTIDDLLATIEKGADREEIVAIIKQIVPEYVGDVDFMKLHREHITKNNHAH